MKTTTHSFIRKTLSIAVSYALILGPMQAQAGWLNDFYNSTGGTAQARMGGAFEGQTQNLYTGGSAMIRVPTQNYQLYSFNPPRFNAVGCGGIDVFLGSFSHINKAKFVAMLKNIGQNALGMAFKAALKGMAPETEQTITELSKDIADATRGNINSCEAAKKLVGVTGIEQWATERRTRGQIALSTSNTTVDSEEAYERVNLFESEAQTALDDQADPASGEDGVKPQNGQSGTPSILAGNVTWRALSQQLQGFTDAQKLLIMSWTGAAVFETSGGSPDPSGVNKPVIRTYAPTMTELTELMGDPVNATLMNTYTCNDGTSDNQCQSLSITPTNADGLAKIINDKMTGIRSAMQGRNQLTTADIQFAEATSLPVQQLLSLSVMTNSPALADVFLNRYRDIIAAEYAAVFLYKAMDALNAAIAAGLKVNGGTEAEELKSLQKRATEIRTYARDQLSIAYQKNANMGTIVACSLWSARCTPICPALCKAHCRLSASEADRADA
jgi:conjugative transfer pilus assembly protein TraH